MAEMDYLTIAEFAESVGVSKQAIYKRLNKDLAPYQKTIDGVKCLSSAAIDLFSAPAVEQPRAERVEVEDKQSIKYLLAQLEEKDRLIQQQQQIIADQTEQIKGLQEHIITQSAATTDILLKQSQLQENFQILLGQQQKQLQSVSTPVSTVETVEQPIEQPVEQPIETPKKKGFFSKIFG